MEKIYKNEIQRLMPLFQAIAEGKTVQWNDMGVWRDIDGDDEGFFLDTFVGKTVGYRIKPEPKYRPFKDAEECWQEMERHQPFGWVKAIPNKEYNAKYYPNSKDDITLYYQVQKVAPGYIKYDDINDYCEIVEQDKSYKDVFKVITFADGTPFGILEEE